MTKKEAIRQTEQSRQLTSLGFSESQADDLRRISMTLHRWYERECGIGGGCIERDETTGRPYWNYDTGRSRGRYLIPDREKGALARLARIARIMATLPKLQSYVQTDPRGASLYILRPGDVPKGDDVDSYYSRGICVY